MKERNYKEEPIKDLEKHVEKLEKFLLANGFKCIIQSTDDEMYFLYEKEGYCIARSSMCEVVIYKGRFKANVYYLYINLPIDEYMLMTKDSRISKLFRNSKIDSLI